jgi:hypothetical protein
MDGFAQNFDWTGGESNQGRSGLDGVVLASIRARPVIRQIVPSNPENVRLKLAQDSVP